VTEGGVDRLGPGTEAAVADFLSHGRRTDRNRATGEVTQPITIIIITIIIIIQDPSDVEVDVAAVAAEEGISS